MSDQPPYSALSRRAFLRDLSAVGIAAAAIPTIVNVTAAGEEPQHGIAPTGSVPADLDLHPLSPVTLRQVEVDDEFWAPKRSVWQQVTIRDCFHKFETDRGGALNNFDKVRAGLTGGHAGDPWMDGLVYEMIRGSSDFLLSHPDPELESQIDSYVSRIVAAAEVRPDGYVNTYTQLMEPGHEWGLNGGLQLWQHEIYNLGGLVDAGIHYYRATGKTELLTAGVHIANTMYELMGPPPKRNLVPCHSLPEEAMVRLYELFLEKPDLKSSIRYPVHEENYLRLAEFWIENRGNNIGKPDWEYDHHAAETFVRNQEYGTGRPSWGAYAQDDAPVFQQQNIHGHAVRATLLCTGIAAAARVNNREPYRSTAVRLWENMVYRRMHVTGGVGALANEEKFGPDYVLPNDAYLETCAAVGASFFHHNMNMAFGHARYADELERSLYNGALSGVSLRGDTYLYQNPLVCDTSRARWTWHECPCCPPMFLKLMGAMPGYIYATDADSLYINLLVGSRAQTSVSGIPISVRQITRYPWDGKARIEIHPAHAAQFSLMLRIPGWCSGQRVAVNGRLIQSEQRARGYVRISRTWNPGDTVDLDLPMPARLVRANPLVQADAGRVAITRGPLVYCVESRDLSAPVSTLKIPARTEFVAQTRTDLSGDVVGLSAPVTSCGDGRRGGQDLYVASQTGFARQTIQLRAVPYYANANRGPVDMAVWFPVDA